MVKRHQKQADGLYHINGKKFKLLRGTRAQVWHGTAYKTAGGLVKAKLMKNKRGDIVSKVKSERAKKEKRLLKAGYGTEKGHFGWVRVGKKRGTAKRRRRRSRSRRTAKSYPVTIHEKRLKRSGRFTKTGGRRHR